VARITFIQAIFEGLIEEMERDPSTFVLGLDVTRGTFGRAAGFFERFGPERILDMPLSEAGFVGAAVGAAMAGTRPICEVQFASFFYCAFDQLCNQAAKLRYMSGGQARLPITFRTRCGAVGGAAAQHSETVYPQLLSVPGLKLAVPSGPADAKGLLKSAIRDDNPVIYFEHKRLYRSIKEDLPEADFLVPIGPAEVRLEGRDLSIITYGGTLHQALDAARIVEKEDGLKVEVLDLRTLLPLDRDAIIATARKTGKVLIAHEDRLTGGIGGEVAAIIAEHAFEYLDGPIRRVAALDAHTAFSPPLEEYILPNTNKIVEAVRELAAY